MNMNQQRVNTLNYNEFRNPPNIMMSGTTPRFMGGNVQTATPAAAAAATTTTNVPPPLPPRRSNSNYNTFGDYRSYGSGYTSGYGGYGSGWNNYRGYGGYGMGNYGNSYPYGSMYGNPYGGPSGDVENRLVQFAEESTRPAFQSIEAMVHTFSSVTMMLESTFFAMTSSFRAILSVADNMGKLRTIFSQFLSTFALIRFLKWFYWRTRYLLGLRSQDPTNETLWRTTLAEVVKGDAESPSTWPILTFLGLLFATPYLVHKLWSKAKKNAIDVNDPKAWFKCKEPVHSAVGIFDFNAASKEELSIKTGQKVLIAPYSLQPKNLPGWWMASNTVQVGLIPSNYVTILTAFKIRSDSDESKNLEFQQPTVLNDIAKENAMENTFVIPPNSLENECEVGEAGNKKT